MKNYVVGMGGLASKSWAVGALITIVLVGGCATPASARWPQWGGQDRNFQAKAEGLADSWPADGPAKLWHRELGTGYSSILVDDGVLYTVYRKSVKDTQEHTIAIDAKTGKTIWEKSHESAPFCEAEEFQGPNATPLVAGKFLYTHDFNGVLRCYDKKTGAEMWHKDLFKEFSVPVPVWGFAISPIQYGNTLITAVGCPENRLFAAEFTASSFKDSEEGQSLVALDLATGDVVWKSQNFRLGYASPALIKFQGEEQLMLHTSEGLLAVDPATGKRLWFHPIACEFPSGVMTSPVFDGKDLIYAAIGERAYGIKLTKEGNTTNATEIWANRKTGIGRAMPVLVGDVLVGARRGARSFIFGLDMKTGKREWYYRGYPFAGCTVADGKLIALDENGKMCLARVTPTGLEVLSECTIAAHWSLSVPSIVGKTMYVRDERHIMALDLGTSK